MVAGGWESAVDGCDAVINLAGHNLFSERWNAQVKRKIRDSRVYSTEHVVTAIAAAQNKPKVLVQASAIGYYGPRGDEDLTETSPSGSDFMAVVCREWEEAAAPAEALGVRLATIRTGIVLAKGEGALGTITPIYKWLPFGAAPVGSGASPFKPGTGQQWMSWVHLDDIVGVFLLALDNASAHGPINGTSPNPVRHTEFGKELAKVLRRLYVPIGPPDAVLELLIGEVAKVVTKGQKVLPSKARELGLSVQVPRTPGGPPGDLREGTRRAEARAGEDRAGRPWPSLTRVAAPRLDGARDGEPRRQERPGNGLLPAPGGDAACGSRPFKAQNMALNSYRDPRRRRDRPGPGRAGGGGGDRASGRDEPVLLKPMGGVSAGRRRGITARRHVGARVLRGQGPSSGPADRPPYDRLAAPFEAIVLEGAGSPVEINLTEHDLTNLRMARHADASVVLVADIERGGVFAQLVGTWELMEPERSPSRGRLHHQQVPRRRQPARLRAWNSSATRTGVPVLGVLPYRPEIAGRPGRLARYRRDGHARRRSPVDRRLRSMSRWSGCPHISNFTDFWPLSRVPGVRVRYVDKPARPRRTRPGDPARNQGHGPRPRLAPRIGAGRYGSSASPTTRRVR